MSLAIPQNFITDLKTFTWGKDWRATRIIKEKRSNGEYYFANIVRYFGEKEDTHDYDIAESYIEKAWLGRLEKFVGKRKTDLERDSKTFGKRINTEAITETIVEKDLAGKPQEREVLIDGKVVYEYIIPVTTENTKKMQELQGAIALNQETELLFVYGARPPYSMDPDTFWKKSVGDYLKELNTRPVEQHKTK